MIAIKEHTLWTGKDHSQYLAQSQCFALSSPGNFFIIIKDGDVRKEKLSCQHL